jgi:t-SNARE complex subunit (syntaxin)
MDTLDRIPLKSLAHIECSREHMDEQVRKTVTDRVMDVAKFIVFSTLIVILCLVMALAMGYEWFYLATHP